jgi:hypothetical protein
MKRRKKHHPNDVDSWGRRFPPADYTTTAIRAMLVADIVALRPLGGPDEAGIAWLIAACATIAKRERKRVDDVFESILAEGAAQAGHTNVALA